MGAEGRVQPLDVGGVDDRARHRLGRVEPRLHRRRAAQHDPPRHPDHAPPGVLLDDLGVHEPGGSHQAGPPAPSGPPRLAEDAPGLRDVAAQPVGAEQEPLPRPAGAHPRQQVPAQRPVPLDPHHPAQPEAARDRQRHRQPGHAADHPHAQLVGLHLPQGHPPGLNDLLVDAPTLRPRLRLVARHRPLVQPEGGDDRLGRAAVRQQRHHLDDEGVRLVRPVQGRAPRRSERLAASFAAVTPLALAVDHDMPRPPAPVGPTIRVVAELALRVHAPPLTDLKHQQEWRMACLFFNRSAHPRFPGVLPVHRDSCQSSCQLLAPPGSGGAGRDQPSHS